MNINDFDPEFQELYDTLWSEYRYFTKKGIQSVPDGIIRELHAKASLLLSITQMFAGELSKSNNIFDTQLSAIYNSSFVVDFAGTKTATVRDKQVCNDPRYLEVNQKLSEVKAEFALLQWKIKSLETTVALLSREISVRIKS